MLTLRRFAATFALILITDLLQAAIAPARAAVTPPQLSPTQKDQLRARLERIYYEQDLMVRNQKVDRSDLKHQEAEFAALKVFERIPFRDDLPGLRASLATSSAERDLKLVSFRALPKGPPSAPAVPSRMFSDENPNFRLSDEQLAERVPFEVVVAGDGAAVEGWIHTWAQDQMRIAEADEPGLQAVGPDRWRVRAHAYRFRGEVRFPALTPRDPVRILPAWAQRDPRRFAQAEPVLWNFVTQTHAVSPQARPLYRLREELLLNSARMSFFVARATPRARGPRQEAGRRPSHTRTPDRSE